MIAKWMNKKFYYQAEDGSMYSASLLDHLVLAILVFSLVAIVLAVLFFGECK